MYLDENMRPFEDGILVGASRQINVMLYSDETTDPLPATVSFVADGVVTSSAEVSLPLVGTSLSGSSVFVGPLELVTPEEAALKDDPPQAQVTVTGTGTLEAKGAEDDVLHHLASEVWVEVEGIFAQDDTLRDSNLVGSSLDVKKDAPFFVRYRVAGTEQIILHSRTIVDLTLDSSNPVHTDFYSGVPGGIVSDTVVSFLNPIIDGLYESEWNGRDNTGAERILIEGGYDLNLQVLFDQNGSGDSAVTRESTSVSIARPRSRNFGPAYWGLEPMFGANVVDAANANSLQTTLLDGTGFDGRDSEEASLDSSAMAIQDTKENAAIFSFIGHGDAGALLFYGFPDDVYEQVEHESVIVADSSVAFDPTYVDLSSLPDGFFDDVFLAILLSCGSGSPDPIEHPDQIHLHLPSRLVEKGVDLALGLYGEEETLRQPLRISVNQYFWGFASGNVTFFGSELNIYDSWSNAAALASEDCGGCSEDQRDVVRKAKFTEATGVSKLEKLSPARYGRINEEEEDQ